MTLASETPSVPRSRWPFTLCIGFIIVGMLLVLLSLGLTLRSRAWLKTAVHVQGTIVAVTPASQTDGSQTFYPIYEAEAEDGHSFRVTGGVGRSPAPTIGDTAALAYPPHKTSEAVVVGFLGLWFFPVLVGAIGAIWTLAGLVILLVASHPTAPSKV